MSIKSKIQALITAANATTGESATDLTGAVQDLVDGYGQGGTPVINPLSVTENGTYTAPSGVDGYSPINVNVPQGITPSGSLDITENGTYDVTEYAEVVVDVSGGGGNQPSYPIFNVFGLRYVPNMVIAQGDAKYGWENGHYKNCVYLESFVCDVAPYNGSKFTDTWRGCTALKNVELKRCNNTPYDGNSNAFYGDSSLETVTLGGIGYPINTLQYITNLFAGTPATLVVTYYVNASSLDSVPDDVKSRATQGNPNLTIIYRSSVTGEVLV